MAVLYCQKLSLNSHFVQIPAGMWLETPHLIVVNNELYVVGLRPEQAGDKDDLILTTEQSEEE